MLDAGAREIELAADVARARVIAAVDREGVWLVGEVGGQTPADFDFNNSPTQLRGADLLSRRIVFATSNGTRALARVAEAPVVLVGSVVNGTAIARRAIQEAQQRGLDICVVCSGDALGTLLSLEDLTSAGLLVEILAGLGGPDLLLDESAIVARRLYRSYLPTGVVPLPPNPAALAAAFGEARHQQHLLDLGYAADVAHCERPDTSDAEPWLLREDGRLLIVPAASV
jgi:2-phosphosulfolactate phosphatase